jgi:hypothetical protein
VTEPTREPESGVVPAGPEADAHEPGAGASGSDDAATQDALDEQARELRARYGGPEPLPYIKRAPSRRAFDLLLLVPFCCVGASIGTLTSSTGFLRHLGLVVAFGVLFAWIRAGVAIEKSVHLRWLYVMGGLVVVFLACGLLSKTA